MNRGRKAFQFMLKNQGGETKGTADMQRWVYGGGREGHKVCSTEELRFSLAGTFKFDVHQSQQVGCDKGDIPRPYSREDLGSHLSRRFLLGL